jgi:DNA-binding CsgD family transcriptional regulator
MFRLFESVLPQPTQQQFISADNAAVEENSYSSHPVLSLYRADAMTRTRLKGRKSIAPAFSLFDEAVHLIHLRWENQERFAVAVAETLKALLGARNVFVGSTDIQTGTRKLVLNDVFAELDTKSVRSLQQKIERCSAAFLHAGDKGLQAPAAHSWGHGNPYATLSKTFTVGSKLGALIPIWDRAILVDVFADLPQGKHSRIQKELFDRLIPHLEIACSRAWLHNHAPSLESLLKRLQDGGLTAREAEVVSWVLQGKTNPEIATIMGVSLQTVKNHLGSAYPKLGIENRSAAFAQFSDWFQER